MSVFFKKQLEWFLWNVFITFNLYLVTMTVMVFWAKSEIEEAKNNWNQSIEQIERQLVPSNQQKKYPIKR